jgi:hypothetical protein
MTVAVQLGQFLISQKQILNLLRGENHFTALSFVCYGAKNSSATFRHFNEKSLCILCFYLEK